MWSHLKDKHIKLPKIKAEEIDKKVDPVLRGMEKEGIKLDTKVLNKLAKETEAKILKLEKEIHSLAKSDFNISSPSQMAEVLFDKLKLPTEGLKKTKSGFSTAAMELKKLESKHKIIKPILEYRELSKLLNTYLLPLPKMVDKNSRLHTTYGQDTATGRINSSNPNLQNIPIKGDWGGEIRKAFVASPGMILVAGDYSQIELRVVACMAEDSAMIISFQSGEDIHARTAAEIFNIDSKKVTSDQRRIAKTVNFGVLYGMSPYGLSQALSISQEDATSYINKYFEIHRGIKAYCQNTVAFAKKHGYVETLFGYKRKFSNLHSPIHSIAESEARMAFNAPIQGTAAEILKIAMIELASKLSVISHELSAGARFKSQGTKILLTIHDEIVVEAPEEKIKEIAKLVKETMESVVKLCVPIEVSIEAGKSLGDMEEI